MLTGSWEGRVLRPAGWQQLFMLRILLFAQCAPTVFSHTVKYSHKLCSLCKSLWNVSIQHEKNHRQKRSLLLASENGKDLCNSLIKESILLPTFILKRHMAIKEGHNRTTLSNGHFSGCLQAIYPCL